MNSANHFVPVSFLFRPYKAGEPNNSGNLQAFRRWDYGGIVGMKAVIADHYTISFDYRVGIKKKTICQNADAREYDENTQTVSFKTGHPHTPALSF